MVNECGSEGGAAAADGWSRQAAGILDDATRAKTEWGEPALEKTANG